MIKVSRAVPITVGVLGLGFVALCVPLLVVATRQVVLLAIPLAGVLAWLAFVCVRLILTRTELRIDGGGVTAVSRRRTSPGPGTR